MKPETENMLELSTLSPGERTVQVELPNGRKLPFWLNIMSADDARLKRHQQKVADRRQERARKGKITTAEVQEQEIIELISFCVTGWKCEVMYNGEVPEFSRKKVVEMLNDQNISWFFTFLNDEIGNAASFF